MFNAAGRDDAVNVARLLREASETEVNALNAHYTFVNVRASQNNKQHFTLVTSFWSPPFFPCRDTNGLP